MGHGNTGYTANPSWDASGEVLQTITSGTLHGTETAVGGVDTLIVTVALSDVELPSVTLYVNESYPEKP